MDETATRPADVFPFDMAPGYLLQDGDAIYGEGVKRWFESRSIKEIITALTSPGETPVQGE